MTKLLKFVLAITLVVSTSCLSNPGRMIFPDDKSVSFGLNLYVGADGEMFLPAIDFDIRTKVHDNVDIGTTVAIGGAIVWAFKFSPYIAGHLRTSQQDSVLIFINPTITANQRQYSSGFDIFVLPSFGLNYWHFLSKNNGLTIGTKYDTLLDMPYYSSKPFVFSHKYIGFDVGALTDLDQMYITNGIEYFLGGRVNYNFGWGRWY